MADVLRERDGPLRAVDRCLDRLRAGEGNALFVVGEAGLGKSSLLAAAVAAAGDEFEPAGARGERMETVVPFGVVAQLLASLGADQLGLIDPGDGEVSEPSAPFLRVLALLREPRDRPLLLVLDDLQWADPDSQRLLAFLVRRLARLPVGVVGALRPWPGGAGRAVEELAAVAPVTIERLEPLRREGAAALLGERAGAAPAPPVLARAWELGAGNPLLIEQLGAAVARGEDLAGLDEKGVAATAGRILLSRFAGLDEASMRCARCASVIGVRFRVDVAVAAAGLERDAEERALEAMSRSGLVVDDGPGWTRFAHPLFAQALYEDIEPPLRRRLHARAFALLAARGLDGEAAEHAVRAELVGDSGAATVLERVGRRALRGGALQAAVRHLEAAVRVRADDCEPGLLLAYARSLVAVARVEEAGDVLARLLDGAELAPADRVEALRLLGQAAYLGGEAERGERLLDEAVEIAAGSGPDLAARTLLDHSSVAWMARGPAAALPPAARAREIAVVDPDLAVAAVVRWTHLAAECGEPAAFAGAGTAALRAPITDAGELRGSAELTWPAAPIYGIAHIAKYAERFAESEGALARARKALQGAGAANGIATSSLFAGNLALRRGRFREALAEADRAEEFAELTPMARPFAALLRAEALLWLGDREASEEWRRAARRDGPGTDLWLIDLWARRLDATELLWQGDARASGAFLQVERLALAVGLREPSDQPWAGHAVRAHLAAGRAADARRVSGHLARCATGHPGAWPGAAASLSRGWILAAEHDEAGAEAAFLDAVDRLGEVDLPRERAEALLALGSFRRRQGRAVAARTPLREALRLAEASEIAHLARLAHAELRLAGGRRGRARQDRDRLTAAELRVAHEAAQGHTNAEIARRLHLSTNTVRTHLKRIYPKLGISSRRALRGIDLDSAGPRPAERVA